MALVSLQQEYVTRTLQRWTQLAPEAEKWHSPAADHPHPQPRPTEPTPRTKKLAESDVDAPMPATAAPARAPANDTPPGEERHAVHDAAQKATQPDLPKEPATAAATPADHAGEAGDPIEPGEDDLTQIRGIGPKFAQTLKDHGITSYRKLASLTPQEIEELEEKLGFSGRFERENWVEQARELIAH
jgi:predicted flap endonuclease-1-like 5' DNA nuclease